VERIGALGVATDVEISGMFCSAPTCRGIFRCRQDAGATREVPLYYVALNGFIEG
jgi:hypothetical protein